MKTGTKTAALVAALLTGAVIAGAQQYPQGRRQRQAPGPQQGPQPQFRGQQQGCPLCGNPQYRTQRHGFQQQGPRNQRNPDFRQQQGPRNQRNPDVRQQQGPRNQRNPDVRQQQGPRNQRNPDFRQQEPRTSNVTPEQRERMKQRHQKRLKLFDRDGDGRISDRERQAAREVWNEQIRKKAAETEARPTAPVDEE